MTALKETTHGVDIKVVLLTMLERLDVALQKLVAVVTGLLGLLRSEPRIPDFLLVHCIIHHEHLVAKHFRDDAMKMSFMSFKLHAIKFKNTLTILQLLGT